MQRVLRNTEFHATGSIALPRGTDKEHPAKPKTEPKKDEPKLPAVKPSYPALPQQSGWTK
jgi:hypothetical protein